MREEKKTTQQQIKKLQDELEEQQRENDELKFDYDRATKEVRITISLFVRLCILVSTHNKRCKVKT